MAPKGANSVNMRDVLSQPLAQIPASVHALLRRPDDLDPVELQSIVDEAGLAVLKAEEAASMSMFDTVGACFRLVNEAMLASAEVATAMISALRANRPAMETSIPALFRTIVVGRSIPRTDDALVEFLCRGAVHGWPCPAHWRGDGARREAKRT